MRLPASSSSEPQPGTLYVVSTPIGNLEDITLRALRILEGVHLVAAEDTRTTRVLLHHYGISVPLCSLFSRNEQRRTPELLDRLSRGESLAVVSDAGTPGLSDPAAILIAETVEAGFPVVPIPGASALLAALVSCGFRIDRFWFEGFLPIKKRRQTRLRELASMNRTLVLYESVHRLPRTLQDLRTVFGGEVRVAVARELTKKFEEIVRGRLDEVIAHFTAHAPRGEFVLVIDAGSREEEDDDGSENGTDPESELLT